MIYVIYVLYNMLIKYDILENKSFIFHILTFCHFVIYIFGEFHCEKLINFICHEIIPLNIVVFVDM